jgi:hypothetical protein
MEVQYLLKTGIFVKDRMLWGARLETTTTTDSSGKSSLRASPSRISTRLATSSSAPRPKAIVLTGGIASDADNHSELKRHFHIPSFVSVR